MTHAQLIDSMRALVALDKEGALVPHGIGGLAADLLTRAADEIERLSAVPAGWKLVPEEATEEMMDAAVDKARKCLPADDGKFGYVQARAAFSAFLTAAPPPPSDAQ